jgi:hypothetical protein
MPNDKTPHWSKEPRRLMDAILDERAANAHENDEGIVALALFHGRPNQTDTSVAAKTQNYRSYRARAHNLLHEGASTVQAFITANRLEAKITTLAGTAESERAAELFTQAVNQTFEENDFETIEGKTFFDAELVGKGFALMECDPLTSDPAVLRLEPLETTVDAAELEAKTVRYMDRRLVKARWAKMAAKAQKDGEDGRKALTEDEIRALIDEVGASHPEYLQGVDSNTSLQKKDDLAVYEGWLKPLGPKDPGRHVVQLTKDLVLVDEPWDLPIPVGVELYEHGFRDGEGRSLARTLVPYATRQNAFGAVRLDQLEGARSYIKRTPGVAYEPSNANWVDVEVPVGESVEIVVANPVSAEIKEAEKEQHDVGLAEAGINPDLAGGEPPPAYSSQVAQLEWKKTLATRLSQPQKHREQFWLAMTRIAAFLLPKIYASKPIRLKAANTQLWEEIEWSKIGPESSFNVSYQLRSGQSLTDSGRLELIKTFGDAKVPGFDALDVLANMSNPDIQRVTERVLAPRRLIEHQIAVARDGEPKDPIVPPIDGQDFAWAVQACSNAFQAAYMRGIYPKTAMVKLWTLWQLFLARQNPPEPVLPPAELAAPAANATAPAPTAGAPPLIDPNQLPQNDAVVAAEDASLPPLPLAQV